MFVWMITLLGCGWLCANGNATSVVGSDWLPDESFASLFSPDCDFPIVDATNLRSLEDLPQWMHDVPVILKNLTATWPAKDRWTKANLLSAYGNRKIKSGSQSSIVHSAGEAEVSKTFRAFLNRMTETSIQTMQQNNNSVQVMKNQDSFLFDTSIIYTIPEFTADFSIPTLFADWDSFQDEQDHNMWHMLSLGPTRSGLPFHNHGKTWITIVHGVKHWFVYPVGFGIPVEIFENKSHAKDFLVVEDWVRQVLPQLVHLPKPPLKASEKLLRDEYAMNKSFGFQPLQCAQRAGDTLFLPSLWSHLTINEGETIGIGGQHAIYDEERHGKSKEAHDLNYRTYEVEKDIGLAIFNTASGDQDEVRDQFHIVDNGVIVAEHEDEVDRLFAHSASSIALLRAVEDHRCMDHDFLLKQAHQLRTRLFEHIEVDVVALLPDDSMCNPLSAPPSFMHDVEVLFFPGWSTAMLNAFDVSSGGVPELHLPTPLHIASSSLGEAAEQIRQAFEKEDGSFGSLTTVSLMTKLQYKISLQHFKKALDLRPFSPEAISMVIELAGMSDDFDMMINLANATESLYMTLREQVANTTAASIFHKVAVAFMTRGMDEEAMPFLQRSIESSESFLPALKNAVTVSAKLHMKEQATQMLELLQFQAGDEDVSKYVHQVQRIT